MIPPLAPTFDAALRDVRAQQPRFRGAAAVRLAEPPDERRDEAVQGLLTLAKDHPSGEVFFVEDGSDMTWREFSRAVGGAVGVRARPLLPA